MVLDSCNSSCIQNFVFSWQAELVVLDSCNSSCIQNKSALVHLLNGVLDSCNSSCIQNLCPCSIYTSLAWKKHPLLRVLEMILYSLVTAYCFLGNGSPHMFFPEATRRLASLIDTGLDVSLLSPSISASQPKYVQSQYGQSSTKLSPPSNSVPHI